MHIKNLLSIAALAGALFSAGVASADHEQRYERGQGRVWHRRHADTNDVIGTASLGARRGVVEFKVTPNMRRDGLQLRTSAARLRILSIEMEYSDNRVVVLSGNILRRGIMDGDLLTIQQGRPAGLRFVRVSYAMNRRDRSASLELIQVHTGSGYTREGDRDFDSSYFDDRETYRDRNYDY